MNDFYIYKKTVDKSLLSQGFAIPDMFQSVFYKAIGFKLKRGESTTVCAALNGAKYQVKIRNQSFDETKFNHPSDILQVRYDGNHEFIEALHAAFKFTWLKMLEHKATHKTYSGFRVDKENEEYLVVYASCGSLFFDCISKEEKLEGLNEISLMDEMQYEIGNDSYAYIEQKLGVRKIRHLSQSIGNSLKEMYSYRCQICGQLIGDKYDTRLIHAHHIDYFTKSQNNNPENIMIVCPNHHGIIHNCNPEFDRRRLLYKYPNGYEEGLLLNKHLKNFD